MAWRMSLGPVVVVEGRSMARRKASYVMRALFVGALWSGLIITAWNMGVGKPVTKSRALVDVGIAFSRTILCTQLALVLLIAPAATAGAICQDRARGLLAHMLMTDLSDAEIVLGKLAARLAPTLGLVLSGWPVLALASLLGGIDPDGLVTSLLATLAVAVLGCALALTLGGWLYLILGFCPWFTTELGPQLLTTALLDILYPRVAPSVGEQEQFVPALPSLNPTAPPMTAPTLGASGAAPSAPAAPPIAWSGGSPAPSRAVIASWSPTPLPPPKDPWSLWTEPARTSVVGTVAMVSPEAFRRIGHALFTLLVGLITAEVARSFQSARLETRARPTRSQGSIVS